ncbi:MAG: hypothetical protein ABJQ71_20485 [Roseibium sp.]
MFDRLGETKLSYLGLLLLLTAAVMTLFADFDSKKSGTNELGIGYHGYLN